MTAADAAAALRAQGRHVARRGGTLDEAATWHAMADLVERLDAVAAAAERVWRDATDDDAWPALYEALAAVDRAQPEAAADTRGACPHDPDGQHFVGCGCDA